MSDDGDDLSTPSKVPANSNRMRSAVVDFALGRSPISGNSRSTPRANFGSTAPDQDQIREQEGSRTEIRFSKSSEKRSSFVNEDGDDGCESM